MSFKAGYISFGSASDKMYMEASTISKLTMHKNIMSGDYAGYYVTVWYRNHDSDKIYSNSINFYACDYKYDCIDTERTKLLANCLYEWLICQMAKKTIKEFENDCIYIFED